MLIIFKYIICQVRCLTVVCVTGIRDVISCQRGGAAVGFCLQRRGGATTEEKCKLKRGRRGEYSTNSPPSYPMMCKPSWVLSALSATYRNADSSLCCVAMPQIGIFIESARVMSYTAQPDYSMLRQLLYSFRSSAASARSGAKGTPMRSSASASKRHSGDKKVSTQTLNTQSCNGLSCVVVS
jgi:hypothetical protein